MLCSICNNQTKVLESRNTSHNTSIRRRRVCIKCKFRFSTIEQIEILDLTVIKRNSEKQAYSHEKLVEGIKKSLHKRTFLPEDFKKLICDIERDIQIKSKDNTILSSTIGEVIMKHLKQFDKVAYVRFASVYQDFQDPKDFAKEVEELN